VVGFAPPKGTVHGFCLRHLTAKASVKRLPLLRFGILVLLGAAIVFLPSLRQDSRPHSVTLKWQAGSAKTKVVAYNIYRSTEGGAFVRVAHRMQNFTYRDRNLYPGVTYVYVVTSIGKSGEESQPSEEVRITVPRD